MSRRFPVDYSIPACRSALESLDRIAPSAALLALGQTVFWDEPMKSILALDLRRIKSDRKFIAGIHDTDYFAKHPLSRPGDGFLALPHNDTTTRGVWSAAAEFSQLFGSETVITRQTLARYGTNTHLIAKRNPEQLARLTEAFGWRGIVSLRPKPVTVADKKLKAVFPVLVQTLRDSVERSLDTLAGPTPEQKQKGDRLIELTEQTYGENTTLAEFYAELLPKIHQFVCGECYLPDITQTSKLLQFNLSTAHLERFRLVGLFLDPELRARATAAYNKAVAQAEMYELDRFGSGAIPFELYIPGKGRGTLRLGRRGGVVMTDRPIGFSYKSEPTTVADLAHIIEEKFGSNCALVGKAVTLIGMLAKEFVFVFHEGASSYLHICRAFHRELKESGVEIDLNPILRVHLEVWDALAEVDASFRLPDVLAKPFGTEVIDAREFAARWRGVQDEQRELLEKLKKLSRPTEFLDYLSACPQWRATQQRWHETEAHFSLIKSEVSRLRKARAEVVDEINRQKRMLDEMYARKGQHWREKIFENTPSDADLAERTCLESEIKNALQLIDELKTNWRNLLNEQDELVSGPKALANRRTRDDIRYELEVHRAELIRNAITVRLGLKQAAYRPSAWWTPLVTPDGSWFKAIRNKTEYYLESLT